MKVVVAAGQWPALTHGHISAHECAQRVRDAWARTSPRAELDVRAVGTGGPRSADAIEGPRSSVGGAEAVVTTGGQVLSPAGNAVRWNPQDLSTALLGLASRAAYADHRTTVIVPLGDAPPAGDATDLWGGGLAAMRAALEPLTLIGLVSATRPLVGFRGMSSALRDGRDHDEAVALAAQAQEARWAQIARETDPVVGSIGLVGPSRLSDAPSTGAAGGLAYCLAAAGARLMPASSFLTTLAGLDVAAQGADVVVGIAQELTPSALDHGLAAAVGAIAGHAAAPAVVIAPGVHVGKRDLMAAGITQAYSAERGADALGERVARVAQTWTPQR